jgi:oxygen-independent coproporphyrinogen III oxidase
MKNEQAGLYIHIPFCLSKCAYCSFYSIESVGLIPQFMSSLGREMEYYRNNFLSFDTIYIGGGTPSLLSVSQLAEMFSSISRYYEIDKTAEVTMEVNPGDVSLEYFRRLREIGVNRLNIGVQSFDDGMLKFLGRRHTAHDAIAALESARDAGFTNLGMDLIYCVQGQNTSSWKNTLQKAVSFSPEHLSCYQLSLEKKAPLYTYYVREGFQLPTEDQALKYFMTTSQLLEDSGYVHYEVSNFSRTDNFKSRHNTKYWQHTAYLGLGPAAHSFYGYNRWWNKSAVKSYLQDIAGGKMPVEDTELLSEDQLRLEALFLGLRTKAGINLRLYKSRYGIDLSTDKRETIDALVENKLVEIKDGFLRPTRSGMAVADSLALI